jgi:RNA polymerase sigma-70 factor (ECF subfamily)
MEETVAFEAVYDRYADAILRYCRVRIDDPTDAEDAAALIFTRAFAAFPPRDQSSLRSWLFAIAHNVIANHYRARQVRGPSRPLDDALHLSDPALTPDEEVTRSDERRALREALSRLPADQRRVVDLRLAGLTGPEIAQVMGRSHAAVKMLQLRAVDRLRHLLAPPTADPILEESHARHPR